VVIRAPAITRTWGACEPLATLDVPIPEGTPIVAARQANRLALAFHPELTEDARAHELFVEIVRKWR
jgi:5'-phosphate synthase pdxT subunit